MHLSAPDHLTAPDTIITAPYPGFPTDAQSLFLALLTIAEGESHIRETIFESRFKPADALNTMGASITVTDNQAQIIGVPGLHGSNVSATDLRGGAAMVIAGLAAKGITEIDNVQYIDRGYDNLVTNLRHLGAQIERS